MKNKKIKMGCETYAKTMLGITVSLKEIKKAYLKYITEFPEKAGKEEDGDMYNFEESIYCDFLDALMVKYNLGYEEVNQFDKKIKLCIFVWEQEPEIFWGRGGYMRNNIICNFSEIQECITKKKEDLHSFMNCFELSEETHKLEMITTLTISS